MITCPYGHEIQCRLESDCDQCNKGRRAINKECAVAWDTEQKLQVLKKRDGSSLDDVVEWAVGQLTKDF